MIFCFVILTFFLEVLCLLLKILDTVNHILSVIGIAYRLVRHFRSGVQLLHSGKTVQLLLNTVQVKAVPHGLCHNRIFTGLINLLLQDGGATQTMLSGSLHTLYACPLTQSIHIGLHITLVSGIDIILLRNGKQVKTLFHIIIIVT